ncbi:hypothetical protein LSTR_LSTR016531 [Laodelphax striatellus]|uniref:Uncharacterized protein n=1 Tax=Laodelphax striatellus TaxID=195883 RepID=A0A482XAD9_LAOST|nr:hypothetical protein LSTR_LSTR016531 [Laodelphax striatellus]
MLLDQNRKKACNNKALPVDRITLKDADRVVLHGMLHSGAVMPVPVPGRGVVSQAMSHAPRDVAQTERWRAEHRLLPSLL